MIEFNGVGLESICPVKIDDIEVSPIRMNATARQRPVRWGADFVRLTGGSRTVTITFALLTMDANMRRRQMNHITAWARSDQPQKLTLPTFPGVYLECICTELPVPSMRQWFQDKMRIVFTTFDNPFWTDIAEKSAPCGTAFYVEGTAEPLMRIERTLSSAASNQAYANGSETMSFTTIPKGSLVIDLNKQTAAVGNTSIMQYYKLNSAFLLPRTGQQTITGTGTIKWRERWE